LNTLLLWHSPPSSTQIISFQLQQLSTTHLDTVYSDTQALVQQQLKSTSVVLSVDESSDGAGDPIAHVIALPPSGVPFLLAEIPHYTEQHTAANLMETVSECATKLEANNTSVAGLINDNEALWTKR